MSSDGNKKILSSRIWLISYLALLFIVAGAGWFITGYLGDKARQEILEYNGSSISLHSSHLNAEFEKTARTVMLLSGSPSIEPALISRKEQDIENANSTLDRYNLSLNSSVAYLMDSNGKAIASSNRNDSDSFVGKSYQFRPYFSQAIKGAPGRYFAIGATSLKRGFYASYPVRDSKENIIGVAVIKQEVDTEESHLTKYPYCFVVDPNGIIFLSGKKEMNIKSLWPVSRETQLALIKSKQFGEKEFTAILPREVKDGMDITFAGKKYLASRKDINPEGWSIVLLTTTERIYIYKSAGVVMTILICAFVIVPLIINYKTSKSAEMVRESEYKFRAVFEQASQLVGMMTIDGTLLSANTSALVLSGVKEADVIGKPFWEAPWWSHSAELQETLRLAIKKAAGGEFVRFDATHPAADGSIHYVDFSLRPVINDAGKVIFLVPEGRDITDRKQAEDAVLWERDLTQATIDSLPGLFYLFDEQGKFLLWNKNLEEFSGYSAQEIVRMSPLDFFGEPDKKIIEEAIQKVFLTGQVSVEADFLSKDQTRAPYFFTGKLFMFEKKTCLIGMGVDITERQLAEKALMDSEKKYRYILENIEDGYYEVDTAGNFTFFNNSTCRMLGYSADELMDKNNREYVDDENAKKIFKVYNEVYRTGIPIKAFDWELIRKGGSKCFVETGVSLIMDSNNVKTGFSGIARDVTERKRAEEELENSFKRLRVALGGTIQALAVAVETRDPYTAGHQKRVADLSRAIAAEMCLDNNRIDGIRMAGVVHDLGKMSIPAEILSKPSKLSEIEYSLIKTHPKAGYDILKDVEFPWPIAQIVLQHHERIDGSGYPAGLKGEEILLEARIIGVADVVEAIASYRPYRQGLGIEKALGEITKNKGILYDKAVVDACLRLFSEKGYKL
ncbi:MAG: PAS domain S-box protein [Candidatus Atribacteria bacterium]|nr:MAG: PAS domain S-box protein [Candidatus Atribacteria bacterium]